MRSSPAGSVRATQVKQLSSIDLTGQRNKMVAAAHELPASGYALEVDGRFKAEFATRDGAWAGAAELKKRFPMLQVKIYDALAKSREEVQLPRA